MQYRLGDTVQVELELRFDGVIGQTSYSAEEWSMCPTYFAVGNKREGTSSGLAKLTGRVFERDG